MERRARTSDRLRLARASSRRAADKAAVEDAEHFTQRPISVPWSPRELSDAELLERSFTTPDGNTVKVNGSMDPLTSVTCIALVTTDRERDPKVIKAMLDLLVAMDATLPASLIAEMERDVLGHRLMADYKAAGGRVEG